MTTLADKLAARATIKEQPVAEDVKPVVPILEDRVDPISPFPPIIPEPVEPAKPIVDDSNEVMEFRKTSSEESAVVTPVKYPSYTSPTNSKRGYQWACGILRPSVAGVYTPKDEAEASLCRALVKDGYLQAVK